MGEARFDQAVAAFARAHAEDPRGAAVRYHEHVAHWVDVLEPNAPLAVQLAARCQHIRRWTLPRSDFPEGRTGYRTWRSTLAMQHAADAGDILAGVGYPPDVVDRVRDLLMKKRLRSDPEVQLLEDAVCLTFIELEFAAFAAKHTEGKVIDIVRKTWEKMSARGHAAALALVERLEGRPHAPRELALIGRALTP